MPAVPRTRYVALLRAINVRGHAIIRMPQLCEAFEAAGCLEVASYSSAGNVLFETARANADGLFTKIRTRVRSLSGGEPGIVFRTVRELEAIVRAVPFGDLVHDRSLKLYVVFLAGRPTKKPRVPVVDEKECLELIGVKGLHAFVVSRRRPRGIFYGFPNSFVERELGVAATSRNWSTVSKLVARSLELSAAGLKIKTRPTDVTKR